AARPRPGWWAATARHRVRAGGVGPRRPPGRRDPAEQNRSPGILRPSMPPPSLSAPFAAWRARYASIVFLISPRRKAPTHNGDDCVDNPPLGRKRGVDNPQVWRNGGACTCVTSGGAAHGAGRRTGGRLAERTLSHRWSGARILDDIP